MSDDTLQNLILGSRYRLIHQVGKGGMAHVFKAYDLMLERPVAIKLLKQDFSSDEGFRERFKQEARAAANLSHPNIVTVHDFGVDPAGVYIVMGYISGTDLKTSIQQKGRYSYAEGIELMIQACAGLGYAHRAGIVHCDVKPQNFLVTPDQRLKITDFGISRVLSTVEIQSNPEVIWGSPQYFSPEQAKGEIPSPASDVYSLGVVMYEVFTGHLPFEANTVQELTTMHQTQAPVDPRTYVPDMPADLEQILLKVLSKEPSARYRTADQLGHVLSLLTEKPVSDRKVTSPVRHVPSTQPVTIKTPPPITPEDYTPTEKQPLDWKLIWLELLTVFIAGGLIPFWLFIFLKLSTGSR